jgi:hypothetical protein
MTNSEFEVIARKVMSRHYEVSFFKGIIDKIHKEFDLVSSDQSIVGDATYLAMGDNPDGKLKRISEFIWLMEKTSAKEKFMVFGNDIGVPKKWLKINSYLLKGEFSFYFIDDSERLTKLWPEN